MFTRLGLLLLTLLSSNLLAQEIPDFSANYSVEIKGLQAGEMKSQLISLDNGTREFKSATQAKGIFALFKPDLVEESSIWQLKNDHITPISYLYQRTGGKKDKYLSLHFNWQKNTVDIDDKKQPWTLKNIAKGTLDKQLYQIAIMRDLAQHKTELNYKVAAGGKLKHYQIDILGEEVINTPLGDIKAIKLKRRRDKSKSRQTTLWCAPSLNYLPVRLEHIEKDGSLFVATLRRLKGIDSTQAFITDKEK